MKLKNLLSLALLLIISNSFAQTKYQKGYYITNSNQKVECLIYNEDWKNNPEKFKYKVSEDGKSLTQNIKTVKEFSIYGTSKFTKRNIKMDMSPAAFNNLNYSRNPDWKEHQVFLEVIVDGEASLYFYEGQGLKRYFYSVNNSKTEQLVYKKYFSGASNVKENNDFRTQLNDAFRENCDKITISELTKLGYKEKDLSSIFLKYNSCLNADLNDRSIDTNSSTNTFLKDEKKTRFNVRLKAGVNFSSYVITNESVGRLGGDFGSKTSPKFGVEAEAIFPFNNYKWSAFLGFEKKSDFENTLIVPTSSTTNPEQTARLSYKSSELLLGLRHYMHLNEQSRFSLHLGYVYDTRSEVILDYEFSQDLEESRGFGFFMTGIGFEYNKFAVEGRLNFGKSFFKEGFSNFTTDISDFNIMFSYSVFQTKK